MFASFDGHLTIVQYLVKKGANMEPRNKVTHVKYI